MMFTACGNTTDNAPTEQKTDGPISSVTVETPISDADTNTDTTEELLEPVIEWWELYDPNGFDTLTALIANPNDIDIDVSYDIVFYKDKNEISRIQYCDSFSVAANGKAIIWANVDVPSATDADDVKLENIYISKAHNLAIGGKYEYAGIIDGHACFDFTFDSKPEFATIWFVLYKDDNGNGRFDKGEISVVDFDNLMEQTGRASFNVNVYPYTDFEVYFTAY